MTVDLFGFFSSTYLPLFLLSVASAACGLICLLCSRHVLYLCALALDILAWLVLCILLGSPGGSILHLLMVAAHIALLVYTIIHYRRLSFGKGWKVLIVLVLALAALSSLLFLVPTRSDNVMDSAPPIPETVEVTEFSQTR